MTKRDYELIAATVQGTLDDINKHPVLSEEGKTGARVGLIVNARKLAKVLEIENARFDEDIFLKACGFKDLK